MFKGNTKELNLHNVKVKGTQFSLGSKVFIDGVEIHRIRGVSYQLCAGTDIPRFSLEIAPESTLIDQELVPVQIANIEEIANIISLEQFEELRKIVEKRFAK